MKYYQRPALNAIKLKDQFLAPRIDICLNSTIPATMKKIVDTGRLAAFKLNWQEGMPGRPHIYWDSDTAKVLEGMAYALALKPDKELEKVYDQWVDEIVSAQQPDGYLNSYYSTIEPENRFTNLYNNHELYCAGHLIEAAVAGYEYLGKRKLLESLCKYADYLCSVFGNTPDKRRGWPGHEEIELALVRLYRATGVKRYLELASYFICDRGVEPNFFAEEILKRTGGEVPNSFFVNLQADMPLLEQNSAAGHAVRLVYLYAGAADVANETGNDELFAACERLFNSLCGKRMYITGGIGSSFHGEAVTGDYDLTNGSLMYAESCASMGLAQFALRMFNASGDAKYLEVVEKTLYNAILAGISLKGDSFFYTNYLEVDENLYCYRSGKRVRQEWFSTSCCPTSYSRFIPQLGSFIYSVGSDEVSLNIPAANSAELLMGNGQRVLLEVAGNYPYDGRITITVREAGRFRLRLRVPAWCRKYAVKLNGEACDTVIDRQWEAGDVINFDLDMPVRLMRSNGKITGNAGRVALQRGPLVYALEECDQSCPVREMVLKGDCEIVTGTSLPGLPDGTVTVRGKAVRRQLLDSESLYTDSDYAETDCSFVAVPYALWQNRGENNMAVWVREN